MTHDLDPEQQPAADADDRPALERLGFDLGEGPSDGTNRFGETNYHRVRDAIRRDIVRGVFAQGARLKVAELANRYGLSPAPIREALNQLEGEGLIIIRPNRGAVVRTIEPTFIQELYEIRLGLEPMLIAKCAACATPRHVKAVEAIEDVFEQAVERRDRGAIIQQNSVFHATIYQIRPNTEALRLMSRQSAVMCTIRHQYGFEEKRLPQIVEEHRALIDALRSRDSAAAEAIERQHISHSLADILDRYAQFQNAG